MIRVIFTFLLTTTFLLGNFAGSVNAESPAITMGSPGADLQPEPVGPAPALSMDSAPMSVEPSREGSGFSKRPPTHQQRCQASCRGIKGDSAHSKCNHNCMSRR